MDMDTVLMVARAALSLGAVLGLIWWANKRFADSEGGRKKAARRTPGGIDVVGRQGLGPKVGLALVEIDGKRLLLGVSEHGVNLLHTGDAPEPVEEPTTSQVRQEIDLAALEGALGEEGSFAVPDDVASLVPPLASTPARDQRPGPLAAGGVLDGSVLSPATWRRTIGAIQARTARR